MGYNNPTAVGLFGVVLLIGVGGYGFIPDLPCFLVGYVKFQQLLEK